MFLINFQVFCVLLVSTLNITTILTDCPDRELIKPCSCDETEDQISCGGENDINLVEIFDKLNNELTDDRKHYKKFLLNNKLINELMENTFKEITFDEIIIENCNKLSKIHKNTFTTTLAATKNIRIKNNREFSSPDHTIWQILSKFVNIENIWLIDNNIQEIPDKAFKAIMGFQHKLKSIYIQGRSITTLGQYAFAKLRNLSYLDIIDTSIAQIPDNAFTFNFPSTQTIHLNLFNNHLINGLSFSDNCLHNIQRPAQIVLKFDSGSQLFLKENPFLPLLLENEKNIIDLSNGDFDCNDCQNYWIKNNTKIVNNVLHMKCANDLSINDSQNFQDCGPLGQALKPCIQRKGCIICGGNTAIDLEKIFNTLSNNLTNSIDKHFKKFLLNNTVIKEIKETTFHDIVFDEIRIENCDNLLTIHRNAFTATNSVTKRLYLEHNSRLSSPDNSIFETLSRFVNIESIHLNYNNISEIPDNAFKPLEGYQNKLTQLRFGGPSHTKLGDKPFAKLNNLIDLGFNNPSFTTIPDNAFVFEKPLQKLFVLDFSDCPLINSTVFANNSLMNIQRPTQLMFGSENTPKQITYLSEKVFLTFLMANEKNTIDLNNQDFDCNDCRNYWLKKSPKLVERLKQMKCSNKLKFIDKNNFQKCEKPDKNDKSNKNDKTNKKDQDKKYDLSVKSRNRRY